MLTTRILISFFHIQYEREWSAASLAVVSSHFYLFVHSVKETLQPSCGTAIQLLIWANSSDTPSKKIWKREKKRDENSWQTLNMALMLINDVNGWQFCFDKLIFCCCDGSVWASYSVQPLARGESEYAIISDGLECYKNIIVAMDGRDWLDG